MPPRTTQIPPMSPIPAKPITNYPTPVVTDRLLIEYVSLEIGTTQNLAYGSLFDSAEHTAFVGSYPDFQLVFKEPAINQNAWWERRVWLNPRIDQDSYNYSIAYAESATDYPTVTRAYVVKRSEYQPKEILTPDPDFPGALLVDQKMVNETNPPEANSLYVTIIETYETLPGPIVSTQDFDTELNVLVYTDRGVVVSDDIFQPEYNLLTLEMRETPRTQATKLRIRSYLQELPPSFQGYQTGSFPFPNLLTNLTWDKVTIAPTPNPFSTTSPPAALGRAEVIVVPSIRPGPSTPALFKTITSYYVSEPSPTTIYAINPNDISYIGISVRMAINSVLNNALSLSVSFSSDGKYGNADDNYSIGASTPSASAYIAAIGTYQTVSSDITRWRGSIWVKRDQQVLLL